jgi:ankyrin repeat protein
MLCRFLTHTHTLVLCEKLICAHLLSLQEGMTPLHHAASLDAGGTRIQALLIAKPDVNCVDKRGQTPLHVCAAHGQPRKAEALFAAGAHAEVCLVYSIHSPPFNVPDP